MVMQLINLGWYIYSNFRIFIQRIIIHATIIYYNQMEDLYV